MSRRVFSSAAVLGAALLAVVVACSKSDDITGVTGVCNGSGPGDREVRVHVDNGNNQPGVKVTLTAGNQVCVINELIVDPGPDNESDQVVMEVEEGNTIGVLVQKGTATGGRACTLSSFAFEDVTSANGRGEAFITVYSAPPAAECVAGF
jgi:hypothetical protein